MKFAIYNIATGQIARSVTCTQAQAAENCGDGEFFIPSEVLDDTHYVVNGVPVAFPAKPAGIHRWDWASKSWQADIDKMHAAKRAEIEEHRESMIYAPAISYDGKTLDADAVSQRNITEKLNDIARREQEGAPMPAEMLVWRDADNVAHTFADQAAMRSWLNGLAIAIAARAAEAHAWSWAKKDALQALGDDVDALRSFDPLD